MSEFYKNSGVSLEAGYESVKRIRRHIARTTGIKGVMGEIGSFGGLFDLSAYGYQQPVLVSGTDGVGTKLIIAQMMNRHDTIGQDAVAMCVNDVLAQGALPLFFLDYIACGKNHPAQIEQIVAGICDGCVKADCALIGGETAEMPDMYDEDEYDVAGFTVGAVEKAKIITPALVQTGDAVIGLASSGVHSNGFSAVRRILFHDHQMDLHQTYAGMNRPLGEVLLEPTRIYVKPVRSVFAHVCVHGIAHITGGGFYENMPRCLQPGQGLRIQRQSFQTPAIFPFLQQLSGMSDHEMFNVFNMGIGMILIVDPKDAAETIRILSDAGETASQIGEVVRGEGVDLQ